MEEKLYLPAGTILQERYCIEHRVGEGGFGIIYLGWDLQLATSVAVKEYFPATIVGRDVTRMTGCNVIVEPGQEETFSQGLKQFEKEMNYLVAFENQTGTVSARGFFKKNNTAYIIMDYVKGITLKEYCMCRGTMEAEKVLWVMRSVMEVLCDMHARGILHRDVSPDNIIIGTDGLIKLVDFGSAKMVRTDTQADAIILIKRGFTPIEQYRRDGKQGPWTDVYGACATIYYMMTGRIPPDVLLRADDDTIKSISEWGVQGLPQKAEAAVMKGLAVMGKDRHQTMAALMEELYPSDDNEV